MTTYTQLSQKITYIQMSGSPIYAHILHDGEDIFSIPIPRFYSYSPMGISQSDSIDLLPQSEYMCGVCKPIRASRQLHFYTVQL
jgi:hypothetical protein